MILENIKIFTCNDGTVIENGYLKTENGKITDIGKCEGTPSGLVCYPGFIDAHTHLGLLEDSLDFEGDDLNESSAPVTPYLRAIDGCNPFDKCFKEALSAGVTTVLVSPGSSNPIGGRTAIIKTHGNCIDNMIVKQDNAIKFALGENPKKQYGDNNDAPVTRMNISALIREALYKAKNYKLKKDNYNTTNDISDMPDYDADCEALIPLFSKEISAHFHAHRADDICTAIRIAKEFDIDYSVVHCTEGYLIKDIIKDNDTSCFLGPNLCDRSKPELSNQSFNNLAELSNENIDYSIITDHPVIPVSYLPLCAALAVKNGVSRRRALESITINPAKALRIEAAVGSLEVGKDADFSLYDGEIFDLMSKCKKTYINGKEVFSYNN